LEILGQPRGYTNGLFHIDVDDLPQLIPSKGFVFENSSVPFFPIVPHEKSWKDLPDSINDGVVE